MLLKRAVESRYRDTVGAGRVTVVTGPRQSGKTTLARTQLSGTGTLRSLDDQGALDAAVADPVGFAPWAGRWVIDEVQRGGEPLARSIKQAVDLDPSPGQFVLTGSPDFLTAPTVPESLAGRAGFVEVWPFTQGEATGAADRFIDGLFDGPAELGAHRPSRLNRRGLLERVCTGGYPEVHRLPARQRPGYCAPASAMPALRR